MNKETYEALKVLMNTLDKWFIKNKQYTETTKNYDIVKMWIDEVAKDYKECNRKHKTLNGLFECKDCERFFRP